MIDAQPITHTWSGSSSVCWDSIQLDRPAHWLSGDNIQAIVITALICMAVCVCFWIAEHADRVISSNDDDDSGNGEAE